MGDHSREVIILRAGIVLDAKRQADGGWATRVRLSQNRELSARQRDMRVRQITMSDGLFVVRAPVSASGGGDSPLAEDGAQNDNSARFFLSWEVVFAVEGGDRTRRAGFRVFQGPLPGMGGA